MLGFKPTRGWAAAAGSAPLTAPETSPQLSHATSSITAGSDRTGPGVRVQHDAFLSPQPVLGPGQDDVQGKKKKERSEEREKENPRRKVGAPLAAVSRLALLASMLTLLLFSTFRPFKCFVSPPQLGMNPKWLDGDNQLT